LGRAPRRSTRAATSTWVGDVLIMYTDGLVERASSQGAQFGTTRLRKLARKLSGADAREIAEALMTAAQTHGKSAPQQDDITIVVVRRK